MPDGGVIVFDDYGSSAQRNLYEQASRWMRDHDHEILELPTAQGLVIKHGG